MSERAESSGVDFWGDTADSEALERYRTLVGAIDDGIYQLDAERRFEAVNDVVLELTGFDREELLSEHVSALFGVDGAAAIEREFDRLRGTSDGRGELLDLPLLTADGTAARCELRVSAIGEEGRARRSVGVVREVEERNPSERERRRVMRALEAAREGISLLDDDGDFIYVNDAYADTFGYEPEEMIGRHWDDLGIEADPDQFHDEVLPNLSEEGQWNGTTTCVRRDDTTFLARHTLTQTEADELICVVRDVTERQNRNRELERYKTIVETVNDGVYVVDEDGRFTMVNEAYAEMTGYDREALLGEHVSKVVDDDVRARARETEAAMGDGEADSPVVEAELETADGSRLTAEATFAMLPDADGRGRRVGVVRDITERKRVQERFEEERDMFAQGPATVFRWTPDAEAGWPVEYVSENVEDLLGYAPEELESDDVAFADLLFDDELDRVEREVERHIDEGAERFTHDPYRVRTRDGDVRWVTDTTKIVRDETGEVSHYLGYLVDITERKERERALEESERRYRALVEHFPNGAVALVDDDLRYQTVGGSPTDVADVTADEVVGRPVREAIPDELADDLLPCYEDGLDGESSAFEIELENGIFEFQVVPIRDEDGEVFAALGMSQDITERVERARELRRKERRFEAVFEDPNILVGLLDPDGTVLDINRTAMEYVDADLADVTGEPFWETPWWGTGEEIRADVREWTERAAAGEYVDFEADLTRPDGQRYVLDGVFRPVTNDDGDVVSVIVSDRDVTERRAVEERLRESERRYRALAENFPNGLVTLYDHDLEYTLAAGQGFDAIPINPADVEGERVSEVWDDETVDAIEPAFESALDGEAQSVEVEYAGRDWVVHAVPITDEGGDVFAGMTMAQDITERKERRRKIEENERRYRTLVENFPNGAVGMFDENLEYTVAGGKMLEKVEASADEIVGKTVRERYPDELAATFEPNFRAAIEDGERSEFEFEFHDRHWNAHALPVRDSAGEIFAGMVMVQDVTDRIERERALQESRDQLQALIELLPVAVFVAEADGEIVEWNEAAEEIWGGEIAESQSVAEYAAYDGWWADTGEPLDPDEWALARALEGEEVTDPDVIEIEGFDGERRTVLNHGMPVRDADGEVSRAVVTLTDITDRREYQRKLETSNERLEQFAHAASHDLQEPLRMVSSYLQLIERRYADELDEDGREFIDFAVDGADRMRDMIDGLLEYSRVDTRGEPFEPVELDAVLDDVRDDLQVAIAESDAEIDADALPRIRGDAGQLRQVFQNLLDNAIEYSGDEPPRVRVSAERRRDEWAISVSDEGIGIDPDEADRVFEVFRSLHSREDHSGTGIGLALCERIVERHGGEIRVDSEPGEGSTFTFTLPAIE